jgi:hypothetical protein
MKQEAFSTCNKEKRSVSRQITRKKKRFSTDNNEKKSSVSQQIARAKKRFSTENEEKDAFLTI